MSKRPIPGVRLLWVAIVLIGASLACNMADPGDHLDWLTRTYGNSNDQLSREEILQFFEGIEGERSYNVESEVKNDECDLEHPMGDNVPIRLDHIEGNENFAERITITYEQGTREYYRTNDNPWLYCRYPSEFEEFQGSECIRFTTSWRFELVVHPGNDRNTICYLTTYEAQPGAQAGSDTGDSTSTQVADSTAQSPTEQVEDDEPEMLSVQDADAGHYLEISMEPINEWTFEGDYNCGSWWLITNTHPSMSVRAIYRLTYGWGPKGTVPEKWSFTTIRPGETDRLNFGLHLEIDDGRRSVNDPFEYAAFIWDWDEEPTAWIRDQFEDDYYQSELIFYSFPPNPCSD